MKCERSQWRWKWQSEGVERAALQMMLMRIVILMIRSMVAATARKRGTMEMTRKTRIEAFSCVEEATNTNIRSLVRQSPLRPIVSMHDVPARAPLSTWEP